MLKPGDNIDSWCGTCKLMLAHTIEAMVGQKPARVHCNTCNTQHSYKAHKPGEGTGKGTGKVTRGDGARRTSTAKPRATHYQKALNGKDVTLAKRYSITENYALGDVLDHPSFGVGVTTAVREGAKIEVIFEAGVKILVHGR
jgi:hypothetical protein